MQRLRDRFGGRLRFVTCGAAALRPEIQELLRVTLCPGLCQGYGSTEAGCTVTLSDPADGLMGHVGAPVPFCEVKLVDRPDLGYLTTDVPFPRGEVYVRGPSVFRGYYKDEAATARVLSSDGWLRTRDIGEWVVGGRLRLLDRVDDVFKVANGEFVSPQVAEDQLLHHPAVVQCLVTGDAMHRSPVAVVVVDPTWLRETAIGLGVVGDNPDLWLYEPRILEKLLDELVLVQKGGGGGGGGILRVGGIALTLSPFTVDNGTLTPTFKLRREVAKRVYGALVEQAHSMALARETSDV